jgi:ABC-type transporter Mla MlaB component
VAADNPKIESVDPYQEHVRHMRASGDIDRAAVRELAAKVWTDGQPDDEAIILDVTAVTSIDKRALAALFRLKDLLGRRLRVQPGPDALNRVEQLPTRTTPVSRQRRLHRGARRRPRT